VWGWGTGKEADNVMSPICCVPSMTDWNSLLRNQEHADKPFGNQATPSLTIHSHFGNFKDLS